MYLWAKLYTFWINLEIDIVVWIHACTNHKYWEINGVPSLKIIEIATQLFGFHQILYECDEILFWDECTLFTFHYSKLGPSHIQIRGRRCIKKLCLVLEATSADLNFISKNLPPLQYCARTELGEVVILFHWKSCGGKSTQQTKPNIQEG